MSNPANPLCDFNSLIPDPGNAELTLEHNLSQKYCRNDPAIIQRLHDPWQCPVEFLPWLAYALSVDVWNPQWPEATQRAICANALQVHLHKGTRGGLEDALAALGVRAEIVEWWQQEPEGEPGTIDLMLWLQDNILPEAEVIFGAELVADIRRKIERSKRASIHYIFKLGAELTAPISLAASSHAATRMELAAPMDSAHIRSQPSPYRLASSMQASSLSEWLAPINRAELTARSPLMAAASAHFLTITHLNMTGGAAA